MRIFICIVAATAALCIVLGLCPLQAAAQTVPESQLHVDIGPPGIPPEVQEEFGRAMQAFFKADKPAHDALVQALTLRDAGDLPAAAAEARKAISLCVRYPGGHLARPEAYQLLGEILLRQNRNDEALRQFDMWIAERQYNKFPLLLLSRLSNDACVELDLALAYCQRGNYQLALKHYTDPAVPPCPPPYTHISHLPAEDAPGTRTLAALKATVLLEIAFNPDSSTYTEKESERYLLAAAVAAPENPMVAFACAQRYLETGRRTEALPYLRVVAKRSPGSIAADARRNAEFIQYDLDHPQEHAQPKTGP